MNGSTARPDPQVCSRWGLVAGRVLGDRPRGTWEVSRGDALFVLKHFDHAVFADLPYTLRVAASLRALGWPTPEPVEEPLAGPGGTWVLFSRLPGRSVRPADEKGRAAGQLARGRLLARFHESAVATGITDQRAGFHDPAELVTDPALARLLRVHESARPDEGRTMLAGCEAVAGWFADHPSVDAPRSVVHGDFAPWNLLFEHGRLTGVVDFEATHHAFQVADFALSWRGYQDEVIRGYSQVRALSQTEWNLVQPVYWAWLFLGVKEMLAAHHDDGAGPSPDLRWQLGHLRRRSVLLARNADVAWLPAGG